MINYGLMVFGVTDYVANQYTAHYGAIQAGEPRLEKEKDSCRILGKRLAEWIAVYVDGRKELHPLKGQQDHILIPPSGLLCGCCRLLLH